MKLFKWWSEDRRSVSAFAAVLLGLAACAPASAPSSSTGEARRSVVEPPREKQTIIGVTTHPITAFAPLGLESRGGNMVSWIELHGNGLVTSDAQGRAVPRLAQELPSLDKGTLRVLDDGRMTARYQLRTDVTWHDGTPFSARDVAFGFRVQSDPGLRATDRSGISQIEAVDALDPAAVLITFKRPFYLADSLGALILWPSPAHVLEQEYQEGDQERFVNLPYWTSQYVHTGPFRLTRLEPGREAEFEAYDRYFLGRPKVDTVILREILDANASYAAILSGAVDISIEVLREQTAFDLKDQWDASGEGKVFTSSGNTFYLAFQFAPEYVGSPALLDARVRRALYLALDRRGLTELAYGGRTVPEGEAKSLLPSIHPLHSYVKDLYAASANDPARALQVFAEAGWNRGPDGSLLDAEGRRLPVEVTHTSTASGAGIRTSATVIGETWKQVGADASYVVPPAAVQPAEWGRSYRGVLFSGSGDGDRVLNRVHGGNIPRPPILAGQNGGNYDNPRLNELIDRYRSALREADQGPLIRQVAEFIGEDLPILLAYYNPVFASAGSRVRALDDFDGGHTGAGYFGAYTRNAHLWEKL